MFLLCLITAYTGSNFEMRKGACAPFIFCLKQTENKLKERPCDTLTILREHQLYKKKTKKKKKSVYRYPDINSEWSVDPHRALRWYSAEATL